MTILEELEDKIHRENIIVSNIDTVSVKAASIKSKCDYAIFINKSLLETQAERHSAMAHEYYHIKEDALYTFQDTLRTRKRREYKANKAMIRDLIPVDKLLEKIKKGYLKYEIAEEFCVTENVIDEAVRIYKTMGEM